MSAAPDLFPPVADRGAERGQAADIGRRLLLHGGGRDAVQGLVPVQAVLLHTRAQDDAPRGRAVPDQEVLGRHRQDRGDHQGGPRPGAYGKKGLYFHLS